MKRAAALGLLAAMTAGCFRTTYSNLQPPMTEHVAPVVRPAEDRPNGWQHFFLYGWVPNERVINAASICGGAEHVKRIETQKSFLQGLIAEFAGYYINIYSPYTGKVVCDDEPDVRKSTR